MADPLAPYEYRLNDSDNNILRKILNVLRSVWSSTTNALKVVLSVNGQDVSDSNPLPVITPEFAEVVSAAAFTRPNDTTAYTTGDLVANSTTAGSVTPVQLLNAVRIAGGVSRIERIRVRKTGTTTANASFRVHLFSASPTVANGDNAAFSPSDISSWIGSFDVAVDRAGVNGAIGAGVPVTGSSVTATIPAGTTLFALLEARAGYVPAAQEQFTVIAELYRF